MWEPLLTNEPPSALNLETPERTNVKAITGRAEEHGVFWPEDVVDGTGDDTHDSEHAIEDTVGRISERDIYDGGEIC